MINEISRYLQKLSKDKSITFQFREPEPSDQESPSENLDLKEKVLQRIRNVVSSERYFNILANFEQYHEQVMRLLIKNLLNKFFTQVINIKNQKKKDFLISKYQKIYSLDLTPKNSRVLFNLSIKDTESVYRFLKFIFVELVELTLNQSEIIKKIFNNNPVYRFLISRISKKQNLSKKETDYLIRDLLIMPREAKNYEDLFFNREIVDIATRLFYMINFHLIENKKPKRKQYLLELMKFMNLPADEILKKIGIFDKKLIERYKIVISIFKKLVKNPDFLRLNLSLYEKYIFIIKTEKIRKFVNFHQKLPFINKEKLKQIEFDLEDSRGFDAMKFESDIRYELKNYFAKHIKHYSILLKDEVKRLETLGLILKDFNDNFEKRYVDVFELIIKKEKII